MKVANCQENALPQDVMNDISYLKVRLAIFMEDIAEKIATHLISLIEQTFRIITLC